MISTSSTIACPNCGCDTRPADTITIPSSSVPSPLRAHIVPSPSEAKLIRRTLSHLRSNISDIDEEIAQAQVVLKSLKHKHRELQMCADEHEAMLRRLPPELLAEMFMYCLPMVDFQLGYWPACERRTIVMGPSQVCQRWRDNALSTPRLWSSICINVRGDYRRRIALAKRWLSRTGSCPLTITIRDTFEEIKNTQLIVDTLLILQPLAAHQTIQYAVIAGFRPWWCQE